MQSISVWSSFLCSYAHWYDIMAIPNYLITESEVRKSQTEALPYWPSDSEVNTVGRGLRFSRNDRTISVIQLFIMWHQQHYFTFCFVFASP